jgi:hypothetical protein
MPTKRVVIENHWQIFIPCLWPYHWSLVDVIGQLPA